MRLEGERVDRVMASGRRWFVLGQKLRGDGRLLLQRCKRE